jgi:hypothetical protein
MTSPEPKTATPTVMFRGPLRAIAVARLRATPISIGLRQGARCDRT